MMVSLRFIKFKNKNMKWIIRQRPEIENTITLFSDDLIMYSTKPKDN
jgi:hypothetical protein